MAPKWINGGTPTLARMVEEMGCSEDEVIGIIRKACADNWRRNREWLNWLESQRGSAPHRFCPNCGARIYKKRKFCSDACRDGRASKQTKKRDDAILKLDGAMKKLSDRIG